MNPFGVLPHFRPLFTDPHVHRFRPSGAFLLPLVGVFASDSLQLLLASSQVVSDLARSAWALGVNPARCGQRDLLPLRGSRRPLLTGQRKVAPPASSICPDPSLRG